VTRPIDPSSISAAMPRVAQFVKRPTSSPPTAPSRNYAVSINAEGLPALYL